ncbi:Cdc6/Cdc18 family protein [Haloarcula amylovorans]|uniref:Cdc6/Cdc18 family protein n=1 Tax=Haloarcula amylovorans TaxID=2562280 RepID=UPI0010764F05|nr:AAA family ATPase [Halomicroarcula amylolytica]
MITDARALRYGFVPRDLDHRDGQIDYLSSLFDPLTHGEPGESVCIHGPTGAGKTTLAKFTVEHLRSKALGVRWGYVNCMSDSTSAAALYQIVRSAGLGVDLKREGTATSAALDYLRDADDQVVVVLDEVDVLDDERTLISLWEIPNVTLLCITLKQAEWLAELDPRAESRLRCVDSLKLDKYSQEELVDILDSRVSHGLIRDRVDPNALTKIADLAAGNARHAIALLRRSARQAEQNGCELTASVVSENIEGIEADMRAHRERYWGTHKLALLDIIRDADEVDVSTLHNRYEAAVQSPKAKSTRRKYLAFLKRYDAIESDGNGPATVYRSL